MSDSIRAGNRRVEISHADRTIFPDPGLTKLDLARYYANVAPVMVPHTRDRPLALHSFPQGIEQDGFFLKDAPDHFPDWVRTARVPKREGGDLHAVLGNDAATLAYLAGQNVVTPHTWTCRADRLEQPDRLLFDLDPATDDFAEVRAAARDLGSLLRDLGLAPHAMTTGSRGLHVVTPLRRGDDYDTVRELARAVAERLAAEDPDRLTTQVRKERRGSRIFLDVGRNAYGQHGVAPYAVRALPGAPVATPLEWDELDDRRLDPQGWDVRSVQDRVRDGDPWRDLRRKGTRASSVRRRLGS